MMTIKFTRKAALSIVLVLASAVGGCAVEQEGDHPMLILSRDAVSALARDAENLPLMRETYGATRESLARVMSDPINVPVPRDGGGGVTHEQHKQNYQTIHDAGIMYQVTGDSAYAEHARDILLAYAALYPTLAEHPARRNDQNYGKLFWQILNDTVWLVYSIQGYDAIVDTLTDTEREIIESGVFRPMVKFLTEESPRTIQRIHNHGTWALAAVGMTAYVLNDRELLEDVFLGLDRTGESGFYRQLELLFSPDGYYEEGSYYQRYSLMPFILFARAVERNEPERKIFEYREGVLLKAIYSALQQSYNGKLFPINNSIKEKGLDTIELMHGVAIAYALTGDRSLLDIAEYQGEVVLSGDGLALAQGLARGERKPFDFRSMVLRDGPNGDEGELAIIRSNSQPGHQALVMKNTAQGMGHGHFDKLHWLFYDNGREVIRDYGSARFLNIEVKQGGGYLPENTTWAKATVAHNTVVVDEQSHFEGRLAIAEQHHPHSLLFDVNEKIQLASAYIDTAYEDVRMVRTLAMVDVDALDFPIVLDVFRVESDRPRQFDLPLYYDGQIIAFDFALESATEVKHRLGAANGYEHLWLRASGAPSKNQAQLTWLLGNRFYTLTTRVAGDMRVLFTETGAGDPDFNLRREPGLILRIPAQQQFTYVSVLEPHGDYNSAKEYTRGASSQIKRLSLVEEGQQDRVVVELVTGEVLTLDLFYQLPPDGKKVDYRLRWE